MVPAFEPWRYFHRKSTNRKANRHICIRMVEHIWQGHMTSRQSEGERELPERKVFYSKSYLLPAKLMQTTCVFQRWEGERERERLRNEAKDKTLLVRRPWEKPEVLPITITTNRSDCHHQLFNPSKSLTQPAIKWPHIWPWTMYAIVFFILRI